MSKQYAYTQTIGTKVINEQTSPLWYMFIPTYKNQRTLL